MSWLSKGLRSIRTNFAHAKDALGSGPGPGGIGGAPPIGRVGTGLGGAPTSSVSVMNPGATPLAPGNSTFGGVTPMNLSLNNGKLDLGDVGGFLKQHWSDILGLGLGAYSAYSSAKDSARGRDLEEEALNLARQRDAELAPLRQVGLASALTSMQTPVTPYDAVGGYVDAGNPYSVTPRGAPTSVVPAGAPPVAGLAVPTLRGLTPVRTRRRG
jgi:hypothetical protein